MKKILGIIFLLNIFTVYGFNLSISPTGFFIPIHKGANRELTLTNNSNENMRVEISIEKPDDYSDADSLAQYSKIYPKVLTMSGNSTKTIRFSIKTPKDLPDGQYKALILFKEIPDNPTMIMQKQGDIAVNMAMYSEVSIPVYGEKGKLEYKGTVKDIKIVKNENTRNISAEIESTGNTTIRPNFKVVYTDGSGKKLGSGEGIMSRTLKVGKNKVFAELKNIPAGTVSVKVDILNDGKMIGTKVIKL
ncbi:MAG: fimbria/pilus periplasmic chaperone [Cetobacterium sp.]|uniref:fimbria/pilus periplasmic chaperone n=1 Tax=Cetobacterium sp. TaxID=2071632 RepID=UPI002FCAFFA2